MFSHIYVPMLRNLRWRDMCHVGHFLWNSGTCMSLETFQHVKNYTHEVMHAMSLSDCLQYKLWHRSFNINVFITILFSCIKWVLAMWISLLSVAVTTGIFITTDVPKWIHRCSSMPISCSWWHVNILRRCNKIILGAALHRGSALAYYFSSCFFRIRNLKWYSSHISASDKFKVYSISAQLLKHLCK